MCIVVMTGAQESQSGHDCDGKQVEKEFRVGMTVMTNRYRSQSGHACHDKQVQKEVRVGMTVMTNKPKV